MPSSRGPQRKSKAKVPKPPRGSGLNPSGEPAIDQLRIPTEQLQMSYFAFDAHESTSQHSHSYSSTQSAGFDDQSTPQHSHSYSGTQSAGFDDLSTSILTAARRVPASTINPPGTSFKTNHP
ncbi:hypothetical protein EV424DRAFT_1355681 [Suillus variegatus]|nr:hypothetical protein EV424DRAFT_1355681 [Suillus variegatus]